MISRSRVKYRQMAKAVRKATNRYYKSHLRFLDDGDREMLKMYRDDRRDLRNIAARLISNGQLSRAAKVIGRLGAAVYEEIPNYVYNYIGERFGY